MPARINKLSAQAVTEQQGTIRLQRIKAQALTITTANHFIGRVALQAVTDALRDTTKRIPIVGFQGDVASSVKIALDRTTDTTKVNNQTISFGRGKGESAGFDDKGFG